MQPIQGEAKSVAQILRGARYSIDYYQREFKWETKQVVELVSDLTSRFQESYQPGHERTAVADYPHYFLGSIIISAKGANRFVVDGQQRLTSLTLLLIHLHRLGQGRPDVAALDDLIYATKYGQKSFNLDVDDRRECMTALFEGRDVDLSAASESVQNLAARFVDIEQALPDEVIGEALPFFVDWLTENARVVEITAYTDDDAYAIFETMNDRGLKLTPADMLKGYLLANITDVQARHQANETWRTRVAELTAEEQDVDADFLKAWLRSQYSQKIRERKKNATNEDWDRIGTEFHRWVRDNARNIGLSHSPDYRRFIERDLTFYSRWYLEALSAAHAEKPPAGLEHITYNHGREFTLQYQLLLAPLDPGDPDDVARQKLSLVAMFVDITLARRIWNNKSIAYSTMSYAMFIAMKAIRGKGVQDLAVTLHTLLGGQTETFATNDQLRVHQQNRYQLHRTLARLTDYVAVQSGGGTTYDELLGVAPNPKHEIEHIWADHFEQHTDEFSNTHDFADHRNLIGDLLLVPKSFNASYGDMAYPDKRPHYLSQNLLARSLHEQAYSHSPGFVRFAQESGLPFRPYEVFTGNAILERGHLYRLLAERVWDPAQLLAVGGA